MPQQPIGPTWGQSLGQGITSGFDGIMRGLAQRRQNQAQALQFQQQTGFNPQDLMAGQQLQRQGQAAGQQIVPFNGSPDPATMQPGDTAQSGPIAIGQRPPGGINPNAQNMGLWGEFQNFNDQMKSRAKSNTADIQAQAEQRQATADWMKRRPAGGGAGGGGSANNLTPEDFRMLVDYEYAHPGSIPPDVLKSRGPGSQFIAGMVRKAIENGATYSAADLNTAYAANKTGASASARLSEGGSSQVVARTANSAYEQLDILKEASNNFPRGDYQAMNTPIIAIAKQGDPSAQAWLTAVNSTRYEYATALARGNKPGEQDIADAKVALPDNITPAQLDVAIPLLGKLLKATVKGQMEAVPVTKKGTPKGGGNDMVSVINPSGTAGKIPRSKLAGALKAGFKEAR